MENNNKLRKQIIFNVHPDMHRAIKVRAAHEKKSMALWLSIIIRKALEGKQ